MKKNTLFRIAAFTTALTIACGTSASCTKKNSSSGNNAVTQSAQESFANSYKAMTIVLTAKLYVCKNYSIIKLSKDSEKKPKKTP